MTNVELMYNFILNVFNNGKITRLLEQVFGYHNISEENYIFRVSLRMNTVIVDVFDNVSKNRFNRYLFEFKKSSLRYTINELNNVFVSQIYIFSLCNKCKLDNNLLRFAYLFKLSRSRMVNYAKSFLSDEFVNVISELIDFNA